MARQADGAAWEEECAFPGAPEDKARQGFFPDGARPFEEIDRLMVDDRGWGNLISAKADVEFVGPHRAGLSVFAGAQRVAAESRGFPQVPFDCRGFHATSMQHGEPRGFMRRSNGCRELGGPFVPSFRLRCTCRVRIPGV
jgi:hypothetical protein